MLEVDGAGALTASKALHICAGDGFQVTGLVLTRGTKACIVNRSAVRWLSSADLFKMMTGEYLPTKE